MWREPCQRPRAVIPRMGGMIRHVRHVSHRGVRRTLVLALLVAVAALVVGSAGSHGPAAPRAASAATAKPNIVFILTDDQRIDELGHMPNVQSLIQDKGTTFDQSFVTNSLCCPSRSSVLTGFYSHTTKVYDNHPPFGGFATFHQSGYEKTHTLPVWMHKAGYRTGLIGKYLNGYNQRRYTFVPAGWDDWFGLILKDNGGYFDYKASDNGVLKSYGATAADYSTDVLGQQAVDFINATPSTQPLFLWWAPHAPHDPATPAPKYASACQNYSPPRSPNVGAIGPDEPAWLQALTWSKTQQKKSDALMLDRCRSLISVDDWVGNIVSALQSTGRLSNTLIVFASDNGWS